MPTLAYWMIALTVSVCATVISAAKGDYVLHLAVTGIVSLALALLAIKDHASKSAEGASENLLGASTARYCGLVWAWGALAILVAYSFILESKWPEWWQFFLGFAVAAAASLLFATMLENDAESGKSDAALLKMGRGIVLVQLIGMVIGLISIFIDGKFPRDVSKPDWAGVNIFFFGALAIAAISANALLKSQPAKT